MRFAMDSLSEVVITLTPLDDSLPRTLTLNPSKKRIEIGRASKTASKGLVASKDNAWFDSPIMSRTHAELHLVLSPERTLYLQDRGSTHGTFIKTQRLNTGEKYPFENGDVITFGQKITSGTSTYPAKSFSINYFWQNWSNSVPFPSPESWSKNVNPGFRAPSEDSESEDDRSREVSFERADPVSADDTPSTSPLSIVPTTLGHTVLRSISPLQASFGIQPELNFVCERLRTSSKVQESRTSSVQIPSKNSRIEIFDLTQNDDEPGKIDLERAGLGSSQANPINLEPTELRAQYDTVSDSDDEGPEVLPISQEPLRLPLTSEAIASPNAPDEPAEVFGYHADHAKNDCIESKKDKPITAESTIADSDTGDSDLEDPFFASDDEPYFETEDELDHQRCSESILDDEEATDDDEDDGSDVQSINHKEIAQVQLHVSLDGDKEILDQCTPNQCSNSGIAKSQRGKILVKDSQIEPVLPPSTSLTSEVLDVSQHPLDCPIWPGTVHRAPSPSDAALKRPPVAAPAKLSREDLVSRMRFEEEEEEDRYKGAPTWHQQKENIPLPLNTNQFTDASHGKMQDAPNNSFVGYNPCPPDFLFNYADQTSYSRYDDGPFTTWPRYNLSPVPQPPPFSMSARHYNDDGQQNELRTNCGPYGQPYWRHNNEPQKESISQDMLYHPMLEGSILKIQDMGAKAEELRENSEKRDNKLSRLPISDIVNDASSSTSDSRRSLKRKADAMASEPINTHEDNSRAHEASETCTMEPPQYPTGAQVDEDEHSEELGLSDAQPHQGHKTQEVFPNEPLFVPSSQSMSPVTLDDVEGPAKKKLKSVKRSRRPVRTFLSGMLAGGLSVCGVLLMYGATAPESLQDTVRLEFQ